jgi:hypothetical protein
MRMRLFISLEGGVSFFFFSNEVRSVLCMPISQNGSLSRATALSCFTGYHALKVHINIPVSLLASNG